MQADWFFDYILSWSSSINWQEEDLKYAGSLLCSISKVNGGEISESEELNIDQRKRFAILQAHDALQRRATIIARNLYPISVRPFLTQDPGENDQSPACFQASRSAKCININFAPSRLLSTIPGIGSKTAGKIVNYRRMFGPFKNLNDLLSISGVTDQTIKLIKDKISFDSISYGEDCSLTNLYSQPSFIEYIKIITASANKPQCSIINELKQILIELKAIPFRSYRRVIKSSVDSARERLNGIKNFEEIKKLEVCDISFTALMTGKEYLELLKELLQYAKNSIAVALQFLRYSELSNYPINALVRELVLAHQRGVKVRVILDKDAEEGRLRSRLINRSANEILEKAGVKTQFSSKPNRLHTKLLLIDSKHVVIGSHNWTACSMFRARDASIYVCSTGLSQSFEKVFEQWWDQSAEKS